MKRISFIAPDLKRIESGPEKVLALFRFSEMKPLSGIASLLDWRLYGHLSRLIINGFLVSEAEETLLMPLSSRLSQEYLLVFGLGTRSEFSEATYRGVMKRMYLTVREIDRENIVLSLPGRIERECDTTQAMDWFLEGYEEDGDGQDISIIEPPEAQKAMLPILERWRLKQLVP